MSVLESRVASRRAPVRRRIPRPYLSPGVRLVLVSVVLVALIACFLFLFVRGSFAFAFPRRLNMLGAMVIAAFTQGVGTVVFHTVTDNRILTPSIIGFDSMYTLMQTLMVFVFGGTVIANTEGIPKLLAQTALMVVFATILYRWMFSGKLGSLFLMLLVGVVIGLAFDSISTFLQRLLSPTEYDMLSVKLFGRLSAVKGDYLPLAFGVCIVIGLILWKRRHHLDALLLGREAAMGIGVSHKRELTLMLILIAVMVAFSTALVGPMTFYGFVVATLAYQFAGSYKHVYVMPMAFLLGLLTLVLGQFVMQHIFYAGGFLTVIIEFVGGALFLAVILRKGKL
ncbi:iron chelate uptake ABC transporter family permease subunit [Rhodococcus sp. BP-252]|uniref:iron chelate uptake ABC transporter family permease subunit n=1 Tax=unclassified Rhodococcus (in: high G+C Gram-positive bacteria) TaxID=192944 RepID=UPI001C9A4FFA|nr:MULTISPECIES: iron chelate uptake ABC transporter family permease subunit [unclassified Rhodococcus (in: high G+C Gram-positive bacteria)]MBY6410587.1 iron chelate uptake ABC transporter family permease subunit [Rhodococcus sp. BP-320]MBY6417882.1 iron chelate uptake ABC transporter family permease subunit [Rhodococcus sp. BP-321]MBY6422877.1 iron chelate uptake ABC transporter family permease subunit [Rhodococcus sp. BP-324]MBY6425143.1 iron chelate uptake ABC transporter family permease su